MFRRTLWLASRHTRQHRASSSQGSNFSSAVRNKSGKKRYAGIVALAVASVLAQSSATRLDAEKEPYTGAEFPRALSNSQALLAMDLRCMLNRCELQIARAYAFGLYVPRDLFQVWEKQASDPLPHLLGPWRGAGASTVPALSLRLVMARNADGKHIAKGFDRSLRPRLNKRKAEAPEDARRALRSLRAFSKIFSAKSWRAKDTITFSRESGGGSVAVYFGDSRGSSERVAVVTDRLLCHALFSAYLADDGHFQKCARKEAAARARVLSL